jgi:catechol 2,3-dioxygenase-like lactoylglutathione lyase family enzyme
MRSIGLLLCLTISAQAIAQAPSAPEPAFTTKGALFGLSVADVEASVRWYTEKFGLKVTLRPPKIEGSTAVVLEGGGLIVELLQRDDAMPLVKAAPSVTQTYRVHGFFKAGIIVDDFDATLARLRARGVAIAMGPYPKTPEQRANVIVRDNSGNLIQFFGPR